MYLVKITEGTAKPKYLHRGSLVSKEHATYYHHPSAASAALVAFLKQRRGKIAVEIECTHKETRK